MPPENEDPRTGTLEHLGGASGPPGVAEPFASRRDQGPPDAKGGWRQALSRVQSGAREEGLVDLEEAFEIAGLDPECQSAYALGLALVRGRFPEAVVLAQQAVRTDHRNPTIAPITVSFPPSKRAAVRRSSIWSVFRPSLVMESGFATE